MSQPSSRPPRGTRPRFINKEERAAMAQEIINQRIPALLSAHPRAAQGVQNARLFRGRSDLSAVRSPGSGTGTAPSDSGPDAAPTTLPLKIKIVYGDSYDVAQRYRAASSERRIAVLNMASIHRPGGGVLRGARAQEETLCVRSTLYASLQPAWYTGGWRDDGVAYTEDVLVFGTYQADGRVQVVDDAAARWFVDVVTCAALKQPPLMRVRGRGPGRRPITTWADARDEERMAQKITYILRACARMHAAVVVLGAFGCGAYANPTARVAAIMRECLVGRGSNPPEEDWAAQGIEEVAFAILDGEPDKKVWNPFAEEFADVPGVEIESPP